METFNATHQLYALEGIRKTLEQCLEQGWVTGRDMSIIACLPGLGIEPPRPARDKTPLELRNFEAPPGSWSQYVEALFRASRGRWDAAELSKLAERGHEWARRRRNFFIAMLRATERAVYESLRSSRRILRIHPPLTMSRLDGLMNYGIDRNTDQGMDEISATEKTGEWMLTVIDRDQKGGRITEQEAEVFRSEVRDFVTEAYEPASGKSAAQSSSEEWLAAALERIQLRTRPARAAA